MIGVKSRPQREGRGIHSLALFNQMLLRFSAAGSDDDLLNNRLPLTATFIGDFNGLLDIQASRSRGDFVHWGAVLLLGARGDTVRSLRAHPVAISRRATVCSG